MAIPPPASSWDAARACPIERTYVPFEGARLETLSWGSRGRRGILLLHGYGAAADWWAFVGPLLAPDWRVVALSFSGNGRSDWRASYNIDLYKREAMACAIACGALDTGQMSVVAHSFGAVAGARLAVGHPREVQGFLVVDRAIVQNKRAATSRVRKDGDACFPTLESAISRFRTRPDATQVDPTWWRHVAEASVRRVEAKDSAYWTWRIDPAMRQKLTERQPSIAAELAAMPCARAFLHGEGSTLFLAAEVTEVRRAGIPVIRVPAAGHHLMLEQPIATASAIDTFAGVFVEHAIGRTNGSLPRGSHEPSPI